MSALVFRLRHVPEEEADAVRQLLDSHHIDWYETSEGNWGIAMPGIWVRDVDDLPRARELIDAFQREHAELARQAHEQARSSGRIMTLGRRFREHPLQVTGIVLFCLFILFVMINPFLQLIGEASG